jgi:5-methylcytosine-specific restriction endonuclease McrA
VPAENLENRIFTHWKVTNRAENSLQGSARWNCRCVCGLSKTIAAADLKRGTSTSCGCKGKKKVLVNEKYNRLTVIQKLGRNNHNKTYSKVMCECGNIKEIEDSSLISGSTKSCGCLKIEYRKSLIKDKNPNWNIDKKNITRENQRKYFEYAEWRKSIFERDNYICLKCGIAERNLNAHHIENFSSNMEKRIDIKNGITLCKKCHLEFHNRYGKSFNNKKQLTEFLNRLLEMY